VLSHTAPQRNAAGLHSAVIITKTMIIKHNAILILSTSFLGGSITAAADSPTAQRRLQLPPLQQTFSARGAPPNPLPNCHGDCDNDSHCAGDLVCFQRYVLLILILLSTFISCLSSSCLAYNLTHMSFAHLRPPFSLIYQIWLRRSAWLLRQWIQKGRLLCGTSYREHSLDEGK